MDDVVARIVGGEVLAGIAAAEHYFAATRELIASAPTVGLAVAVGIELKTAVQQQIYYEIGAAQSAANSVSDANLA